MIRSAKRNGWKFHAGSIRNKVASAHRAGSGSLIQVKVYNRQV